MPKVSVIIPTYNNAQFLPETLDCVLNQTIKDVEALVIDDGSTDTTKEVMSQFTQQYPDRVVYITQKNQGPAAARNNGIKRATGDYIAFVDSDDLWEKEKLEIQLKFLENNPEYSFAYSDVYAMDENGRIGKTMMSLKHPVSGDIFYPLLKENFISIPTSIVSRKCFEKVKGFCEDPQIISTEDHHFWLQLAGYFKGGYINKPLAKYRIRSGSLSSQGIRQRERELLVIDKIAKQFPAKYSVGKKYFHESRANLYFEMGFISYRNNEFDSARSYFKKSLKENVLLFSSLKLLLIVTLFPASYIKRRNEGMAKDETGLLDT